MFKQLVTVCDSTGINNFILAFKRTQLPVRALPNPWGPQCDKIRPDVSHFYIEQFTYFGATVT